MIDLDMISDMLWMNLEIKPNWMEAKRSFTLALKEQLVGT